MTTLFVLLCICAVVFTVCAIIETWIYWRQYKAILLIAEYIDCIDSELECIKREIAYTGK